MLSMTRTNIGYKPNFGTHNFAVSAKNYVKSYIYSKQDLQTVINVSLLAGEPQIYDLFPLPQVRQTGG